MALHMSNVPVADLPSLMMQNLMFALFSSLHDEIVNVPVHLVTKTPMAQHTVFTEGHYSGHCLITVTAKPHSIYNPILPSVGLLSK